MAWYIFTHKKDLDGITSAAIMQRYLDKNKIEGHIDFIDYSPLEELTVMFAHMANIPRDSTLVLVDFGENKTMEDIALRTFEELHKKNVSIHWLDHHNWDPKFKKELSKYAEITVSGSKEHCGAELAYAKFMPDDSVSEGLARLGRDADLDMWEKQPPSPNFGLTECLGNVITYYNYIARGDLKRRRELLLYIVKKLAAASLEKILTKDFKNPFLDDKSKEDYFTYKKLEASELRKCIDSAEKTNLGEYTLVISFAEPIITTTVSGRNLISHYNADIAIVLQESGSFGIRRNKDKTQLDCAEIARLFNGGGHVFAAGGEIGFKINNKEELEKAKGLIKARLTSFFSK